MSGETVQTPEDWLRLDRDSFLRAWYQREYTDNAYRGAAGSVQKWMHSSIEKPHPAGTHFDCVLELGGGSGEHLSFVRHGFNEYTISDKFPISVQLQSRIETTYGVKFQLQEVERLTYGPDRFDRVLHTCLLHHVSDVEQSLIEIRRVLKPGGVADLFVSSDPGVLFRIGRWAGPGKRARRRGLHSIKSLVDARDHKGHVGAITRLIHHVYRHDEVMASHFPIPLRHWDLNLWTVFRVVKNREGSF